MKTLKVGIITLYGLGNYGNRLQNYALQQALRSLGCYVETVVYHRSYGNSTIEQLKSFYRLPARRNLGRLLGRFQKKQATPVRPGQKELDQEKTQNFLSFNQLIAITPFEVTPENVSVLSTAGFDCFVVGSDQVWNPYYRGSRIEFLAFAPAHKRLSYAASFGMDSLPRRFYPSYRAGLNNMADLSVRENEGAAIIRQVAGKEAQVHVDPTMLLTREEWAGLATKSLVQPQAPYLLTYFLGSLEEGKRQRIKAYAEENGLETVTLGDEAHPAHYSAGPAQFLAYFQGAAAVVTDSFHGMVFSLLFHRPYVVIRRAGEISSGFSRIRTLLGKFSLPNRFVEDVLPDQLFDVDFSSMEPILEKERNASMRYLKDAVDKVREVAH